MPTYTNRPTLTAHYIPPVYYDGQVATTAVNTYDYKPNNAFTLEGLNAEVDACVTHKELNKFANKIYKIITEHIKLDITEDEFMEIVNE